MTPTNGRSGQPTFVDQLPGLVTAAEVASPSQNGLSAPQEATGAAVEPGEVLSSLAGQQISGVPRKLVLQISSRSPGSEDFQLGSRYCGR